MCVCRFQISSLTVFLNLNYIDMFRKHSNHFWLACNLMKGAYLPWASSIRIAFKHLKDSGLGDRE